MLTQLEKDVLKIISSAISGKKFELADGILLDDILKYANSHNAYYLFYAGLINSGVDNSSDQMRYLFQEVVKNVRLSERQKNCIHDIVREFNRYNIDYMLLKGSVLKYMYPCHEMRRMGDIDILIKKNQYEKIRRIFLELGFVEGEETGHEYRWRKTGGILVELHKQMVPAYDELFHSYYDDGWSLTELKMVGNQFFMSDEDFFVHLFMHFSKHYREAGIGVLHMCDLWIFLKNKSNLNFNYIDVELKKLKLDKFFANVYNTLTVWFADAKSTEMTDFITSFILKSGSYGIKSNIPLYTALRNKSHSGSVSIGKLSRMFMRIFMPVSSMRQLYPSLKKYPFLLPLFWIHRWINAIVKKRDTIKNELTGFQYATTQKVEEYGKNLEYVGLE